MKKHGRHGKRWGASQSARFFARRLTPKPSKEALSQARDFELQRCEQIQGWVALLGYDQARARVVEIYGEEMAAKFLGDNNDETIAVEV